MADPIYDSDALLEINHENHELSFRLSATCVAVKNRPTFVDVYPHMHTTKRWIE